jgi:uncharacterized protein (TIGR02996 family)
MSDVDRFIHGILENPDEDAPRLLFADWLAEHGRPAHAELIRTQCELARLPQRSQKAEVNARRKELAAREKELLRQPEFSPKWPDGLPEPPYEIFKKVSGYPEPKYERGFIACLRVRDGELMAPEWEVSPWNTLLREGKLLALEIDTGQGGFQMDCYPIVYEMADLANHPALCRVTRISVFEGNVNDDNLGLLAQSPLLTQLRELWMGECTIHLSAIKSLVASPSIKQLRVLYIDLFTVQGGKRGDKKGLQIWQLVASSPNMASLERLWIGWGGPLENKAVEALIQSPYLKESLRLDADPSGALGKSYTKEMLADLSPANVKALRKRFPNCL